MHSVFLDTPTIFGGDGLGALLELESLRLVAESPEPRRDDFRSYSELDNLRIIK